MLIGMPGVKYCSKYETVLEEECFWMFILAVSQLIQVPFFTAWRWFVKFDDGRLSTGKMLNEDEEDGRKRYLPENPWQLRGGEDFETRDAKKDEDKRRKNKMKNFRKRYRNPVKLINGLYEKGKSDEESDLDVGEKYMAHEKFPFNPYQKVGEKVDEFEKN